MPTLITGGLGPGGLRCRVSVIDQFTLDVIFRADPDPVQALNPASYTVRPGITVAAVTKITTRKYRLTTSAQTPMATYVVVADVDPA